MHAQPHLTTALYDVYLPRFELLTKFGYDKLTDGLDHSLLALEQQLPEVKEPQQRFCLPARSGRYRA